MYLKTVRVERFAIGEGSVKIDHDRLMAYRNLLVSLGTAAPLNLTPGDIERMNSVPAPSHTEMVEALAPEGDPDLIALCYWMPDLDMYGGDSLVSAIRAKYNVNAEQTIVLSESGIGVFSGALEYISLAIKDEKCHEVWLFYLNQFLGGSPADANIFGSEPGLALWLKIVAHQGPDENLPLISVSRKQKVNAGPNDVSDAWHKQAEKIDLLARLGEEDHWCYRYECEHNDLAFEVNIERECRI